MGLAQGTALREKILGVHECLRELDALRLEQPWWLPYRVFLTLAERKAANALVPALQRTAPAMLSRMQGIAEGAGLPLRSLCLLNAMEAFLSSMEGRTAVPLPGACSAVAVRGARCRGAGPTIVHNFDYLPVTQPFFILRESRPGAGWRSLDFAVAPQAGVVDGMNEKGLAITLNYAFVTDRGQPNPLVTMLIAEALAACASVTDAVGFITARPRWGAGILMLADASGDLASVELSNTRTGVRRPAAGEDYLLFTNVCCCPETLAVQVPGSATFQDHVPQPLRGRPVLEWHAKRARRLEELLRNQAWTGPDELAALMADHGAGGMPDGATPCVHTDYWRTTACLQWFPATRRVRVSYSTACTARYVEIGM
jgi:hypothetical protein